MNKLIFIILVTILVSCKKDSQSEIVQSAKDKSLAQMSFLDVFKNTLDIVPLYTIGSSEIDSNIRISITPSLISSSYPKIISIDYGSVGYVGIDGKTRSGKIYITLSGDGILNDPFDITFEDFSINETILLGTINCEKNITSSNFEYNLVLNSDVKCMNANGTMSWNGVGLLNRVSGDATVSVLDDIYEFSETTQGQDFKGRSYDSRSVLNYTVDFSCRYLVIGGISDFNPNKLDVQVVDYGEKSCDGQASVSVPDLTKFYFILQ